MPVEQDYFSISEKWEGMIWNGTITEISRFNVGFENPV